MKSRWMVAGIAAILGIVASEIVRNEAWAQSGAAYKECTVIAVKAHPELGPRWSKGFQGDPTPIPAGWSVVSAVSTELPGILVCR